jgi:hypothetical protein
VPLCSFTFHIFGFLACTTILTMLSLYDLGPDLLAKVAEHFISMYDSPTDPYRASIEQAPIIDRGGMIQI